MDIRDDETNIRDALAAKGYAITSISYEPVWIEPGKPVMVHFGGVELEGKTLATWHGGWTITIDPPVNQGPEKPPIDRIIGKHGTPALLAWISEFPQAGDIYDDPADGFIGSAAPPGWWEKEIWSDDDV